MDRKNKQKDRCNMWDSHLWGNILQKDEDFQIIKIILNTLKDGVYITDGESKTIFVNESYEKLSGTNKELFLGKKMNKIVEEGLIDVSATCEVLKTNREVTMNQILNNKNEVLITSTPLFSSKGDINMVVTTVRNVTELNNLKDKLHEKERNINKLKYLMEQESNVIGKSKKMKSVLVKAKKVSSYDASILITGETGVGKDVVAKYIYENGSRCNKPFMQINCTEIPYNLMESELFGYEPGAFTGALKKGKRGIFELANGGTIFLDEIGELPLDLQVKLLRVIQNKKIRKVGGTEDIKIDVRLITATNRNLVSLIDRGKFREDLYYRINVIPIFIPPLRERKEDLIPLVLYFLDKNNEINKENKKLSEEALKVLYEYDWPGNVRQLKNIIERVFILSKGSIIQKSDLPEDLLPIEKIPNLYKFEAGMSLNGLVKEYEKNILIDVMKKTNTSKEAAEILGIDASTLSRKKQKYSL